jgi:DNA-binding NarL/FixJ family response regulator
LKITLFDDQINIIKALAGSLYQMDTNLDITLFDESIDLLAYLQDNNVDIIVMDLLTNDPIGLDIIKQVKNLCPRAYFVVYSIVSSYFIRQCVNEIGVHIFISKMNPPYKAASIMMAQYHDNVVR